MVIGGSLGFGKSKGGTSFDYETPLPGWGYKGSQKRGQRLLTDYMSALFGTDPSAFARGKGTLGEGAFTGGMGEGGAFGGQIGAMLKSLGGGYDTAIGGVRSAEGVARRETLEREKQGVAEAEQSLAQRGLANSTIMQSYQRGASYDTSKALADITAQAAAMRGELEVGRGQALASGQQYGIEQQQNALSQLLAFYTGTAGFGPSGWNTLFTAMKPVLRHETGSGSKFGGELSWKSGSLGGGGGG